MGYVAAFNASAANVFTAQYSFLPSNPRALVSKSSALESEPALTPDGRRSWNVIPDTMASELHLRPIQADGMLLLILLCFFSSCKMSLDLLSRGGSPRRRWAKDGEIEEVSARHVGLLTDLERLLSDDSRLRRAAHELQIMLVISRSDDLYTLDAAIRARVLDRLPPELHSSWRQQALVIVHRLVPWKYLEPAYVSKLPLVISANFS